MQIRSDNAAASRRCVQRSLQKAVGVDIDLDARGRLDAGSRSRRTAWRRTSRPALTRNRRR